MEHYAGDWEQKLRLSEIPDIPARSAARRRDKSEHYDGTFSRTDFFFDAENNRYVCPTGKYLKPPQ